MGVIKFDKKDIQILSILDWNARMPLTQIARQTKLNKDVVKYRINNLEKKGIIKGYYTIINTPKLGYITIRIYFDLINTNKIIERRIIEYLDKKLNAGQIFTTDGEHQLGIIVWEKSIYEFDEKLREFKDLFGKYINKESMSIFTTLNHYPRKIFSNLNKEIILKEEDSVKLKGTDLKILKELSKNARITSTELSIKLKIPQSTIVHRIKELGKREVILGYRAIINIEKLGYEDYFLEIYTNKNKEVKEIENFAKTSKNCIYTDYVFPGADIEIETEFENKYQLLKFIENLKEKFPSIKKIKYWSTLSYEKMSYFP